VTCRLIVAFALGLWASAAQAVQPDEILADPALEARARAISRDLRCPVCQGETIDESNAPIARDLRLVVRERLVAGDSDSEVIAYVEARFGEGVLYNPRAEGVNWILWLAGPGMLALGAGAAVAAHRRRQTAATAAPSGLSAEEERALARILDGAPVAPGEPRGPDRH
jgi:cytochrome c-type biogenesis protein CcmH